jgi:hypothetical protein
MGWSSLIISLYLIDIIIGINLGATFKESNKRQLNIVRRSTFDEQDERFPMAYKIFRSALSSSIYFLSLPVDAIRLTPHFFFM